MAALNSIKHTASQSEQRRRNHFYVRNNIRLPDYRKHSLWRHYFAVLIMFFLCGGFNKLFGRNVAEQAVQLGIIYYILIGIILTFIVILLLTDSDRMIDNAVRKPLLYFLFTAPIFSAIFISPIPQEVLPFALATSAYLAFGAWLSCRFTLHEIETILWISLILLGFCSLTLLIINAEAAFAFDVMERDNIFGFSPVSGITGNKNSFGALMCLWFIIAIRRLKVRIDFRNLTVSLSALIALFLLISSHAALAIVTAVLLIVILMMYRLRIWLGGIGIVLALLTVLTLALSFAFFETYMLTLVGRESNYSGRTNFWGVWFIVIRDYWLFGYGYGSFFAGTEHAGLASYGNLFSVYYTPPTWHNGFLELAMDLGVPLALLVSILMTVKFIGCWFAKSSEDSEIYIILIAFLIIINLGESLLINHWFISTPLIAIVMLNNFWASYSFFRARQKSAPTVRPGR